MGKRGNEHGQVRKEDLDAVLASSGDAPKGPFQKASDDVMKRRRIVRSNRKFSAKNTPQPSAGNSAPSNSVFSSVSLNTKSSSAASVSASASGGTGGGNPFGGFSFGSAPAPSPAAAATKPAFPAFAMPAPATKPAAEKPLSTWSKPGATTDNDKALIECAQGFLKHMESLSKIDTVGYQCFVNTFCALAKHAETTVSAAAKTSTVTTTATTTTSTTKSNNWDPSRPLFGAGKPLISPTAGTPGATAASSSAGGFSFNPSKTGAATTPVPAFSFSTTPTPAVKAAAATTSASATKPESDDAKKEEDGDSDGELAAADDNYEELYKTDTKVLHVLRNEYIKGVLKLEKHKKSGKHRLVVRDKTVGTVRMNVAIPKDMPLSKSMVPATARKGPTPIVLIKAVFDDKSDKPEDFKIIVRKEEHEKLYNALEKLV